MVRKIRDLVRDLEDAGFIKLKRRGKGDHEVWRHPAVPNASVVLDGKPGDDVHPYQETDVKKKIARSREATN
jgi:predicted RNA binding protein YcfA (HicA-like mRNA interferase family)